MAGSKLQGLESVDWSALEHAYGSAADIPELLELLASGVPENVEEALDAFCGNIIHQGTVYSATAPTVPFLIQIATDARNVERHQVLQLLDAIAEGWLDIQFSDRKMPIEAMSPFLAEHARATLSYYRASHQAVMAGFNAFVGLLNDPDSDVRLAAAFLLSSLDELRHEVAPVLMAAFHRDPSDQRQAELLLALMVIAARRPDEELSRTVAQLAASHIRPGSSATRVTLAAVLCLLTLRSGEVEALLEIVRAELSSAHDAFVQLPWSETSDLFSLVSYALAYERPIQCHWIAEGLRHPDIRVVRSALYRAEEVNMRLREVDVSWIPHLEALVHSPDDLLGSSAADSLFALGTPGIEVLQKVARSGHVDGSRRAAAALKRVRSVHDQIAHWTRFERPLFPPSVKRLVRSIDEQLANRGAGYIEALRKAVDQLSCHGTQAREAAATVLRLTEEPRFHPWVILSAIRCLWRITGDAELVVPLVLRNLRPEPASLALLDLLGEIGPGAAAALPQLRSIVDNEERFMKWGFTTAVGLMDEAFADRAAAATRAISHP